MLNRARLANGAGVGAAALVPAEATVPTGQIALGIPARLRPAPDLRRWVIEAVHLYQGMSRRYRNELRRIG